MINYLEVFDRLTKSMPEIVVKEILTERGWVIEVHAGSEVYRKSLLRDCINEENKNRCREDVLFLLIGKDIHSPICDRF